MAPRPRLVASSHGMLSDPLPADWVATRPCPTATTGVAGDVLVRAVFFGAHARYTLSEVPGPDQVRFTCVAEATRQARDYARQRGVDVWSDDGDGRVAQLLRFRLAAPPPERHTGVTSAAPEAAGDASGDVIAYGAPSA